MNSDVSFDHLVGAQQLRDRTERTGTNGPGLQCVGLKDLGTIGRSLNHQHKFDFQNLFFGPSSQARDAIGNQDQVSVPPHSGTRTSAQPRQLLQHPQENQHVNFTLAQIVFHSCRQPWLL